MVLINFDRCDVWSLDLGMSQLLWNKKNGKSFLIWYHYKTSLVSIDCLPSFVPISPSPDLHFLEMNLHHLHLRLLRHHLQFLWRLFALEELRGKPPSKSFHKKQLWIESGEKNAKLSISINFSNIDKTLKANLSEMLPKCPRINRLSLLSTTIQ
jgi:hypothetical protein